MIALTAPAVEIRKAWPDDQRWCASTFREQLSRRASYQDADRIVDRVFNSERTHVLVATDPSRPRGKQEIAWLAYVEIPRVRAVLFVYVRKEYRGQGLARRLVDTAWPKKAGQWVHAGLSGGSTAKILERFPSTEVDLGELI